MFVPNSFTDGSAGGTPITAATLNNLENGLVAADITNPASAATTALAAAITAQAEPVGLSAATKTVLAATYAGSTVGAIPSDYVKLLPFFAAVANRNAARASIVQIGDSITEGAYCSNLSQATTTARLSQSLRARFPVLGVTQGRGFIPVANASPSVTPIVTPSGGAGSSTGWGPSWAYITVSAAGQIVTVSLTGTSFDIMYLKGSGTGVLYYTIDGGTAVTFDTSSGTAIVDGNLLHVAMTAGTHTIVIGWSSGGTVYLDGIIEYNGDESAGINVVRGGRSGTSTTDWLSQTSWYDSIPVFNPALIILQFGVNDSNPVNGNLTSAQFKTNLQTLITGLRAKFATPPPFALSMMYERIGSFVEPWQNYVTRAGEIAASDAAVVLIDHSKRMPKTTVPPTYGLYSGDQIHPSDKGYAMIAETVASVLTPR